MIDRKAKEKAELEALMAQSTAKVTVCAPRTRTKKTDVRYNFENAVVDFIREQGRPVSFNEIVKHLDGDPFRMMRGMPYMIEKGLLTESWVDDHQQYSLGQNQ